MHYGKRTCVVALVWLATSLVARATAPRIDEAALLSAVRTLASAEFEGRRTGTAGGIKARDWIIDQFKRIGLAPMGGQYAAPFRFKRSGVDYDAANVVGLCKGRNGGAGVVVFSAHYDHDGVRNGALYPGADDNASGVAVLLETARFCVRQPFAHNVVFVSFDAEELGLQGAKAFVANPPVSRGRMVLNVNLDMVARGDKGELYVAGPSRWPAIRPALEDVARRAPIKLLFGHDGSTGDRHDDWTNQSDHGLFHAAGIPFVYFGVEDHADYHRPTDTADKINPTFFHQAAETILDAMIALDALTTFK